MGIYHQFLIKKCKSSARGLKITKIYCVCDMWSFVWSLLKKMINVSMSSDTCMTSTSIYVTTVSSVKTLISIVYSSKNSFDSSIGIFIHKQYNLATRLGIIDSCNVSNVPELFKIVKIIHNPCNYVPKRLKIVIILYW